MSKNHHTDHLTTIADAVSTKVGKGREHGTRITDKELFGWRTLVPAGPAHREWLDARRVETAADLAGRTRAAEGPLDAGEPTRPGADPCDGDGAPSAGGGELVATE